MNNKATHAHGHAHGNEHHGHGPYWKRAHRDWRFVVAVILMLAAIVVYVLSDDLALRFDGRPHQPVPADVAN